MQKEWREQLNRNQELYLAVKINSSAPRNEIKEVMEDGTVKINIFAPPEKGKANKELIKFLARELGMSKNNVIITKGNRSEYKSIRIVSGK